MCGHLVSKERRCRWRVPDGGSDARAVTDRSERRPVRARSARAGTAPSNRPSTGLPSPFPRRRRPAGSSNAHAPASEDGPARARWRAGTTRTARARTGAPRRSNRARTRCATRTARFRRAGAPPRAPPARTSDGFLLAPARRRWRRNPATESRCQGEGSPSCGNASSNSEIGLQAARSRASGGNLRQSRDGRRRQLEPGVGPMAGIERVGQKQPVEVRDVTPDRGIEQVALVRPGGMGQGQIQVRHDNSPYMV